MKTKLGLFIAALLVVVACENDLGKNSGTVDVVFSSSLTGLKSVNVVTVEFTDLVINVKEIKFKVDDDMKESGDYEYNDSVFEDVKMKGPFNIVVLKDKMPQTFALNNFEVPNAPFEKIEFKLDVNEGVANTDPMYNKSFYLKGTVNGVPFIMWHNKDEEFKIKLPESDVKTVDSNSLEFEISMQLGALLNSLSTLDMSKVADGNKNGIIEIGPNDTDGNSDYADKIVEFFKKSFKAASHEDDEDDDDEKDHD